MLQAHDSLSLQEDEKARAELKKMQAVRSFYVSRRIFSTAKKTGVPVIFD